MKRNWMGRMVAALLLISLLLMGAACAKDEPDGTESEELSYDGVEPRDCLSSVTYLGLSVSYDGATESKGEAIWQAVLDGAVVREYPEAPVAYYVSQIRAEYRYLANREGLTLEELLSLRGMSEETVRAEAEEMVKSDLVFLYIVEDAEITLSESERTEHYDRYADRYVEKYGFDRAYVDERLRDEVYDSMLFDKTVEYLVLHNEVENG